MSETEDKQAKEQERVARLVHFLNHGRPVLDRAIGAFAVAGEALTALAMVLNDEKQDHLMRLCAAVPSALHAHDAATAFLDMVAFVYEKAGQPPPRFHVTCPECDSVNATMWTHDPPPGGVAPVKCAACGYMILSESEGNPVEVKEGDAQ